MLVLLVVVVIVVVVMEVPGAARVVDVAGRAGWCWQCELSRPAMHGTVVEGGGRGGSWPRALGEQHGIGVAGVAGIILHSVCALSLKGCVYVWTFTFRQVQFFDASKSEFAKRCFLESMI